MDRTSALLDQANISFQVVAGLGLPGLLHVRTLSLSAVEVETSLTANSRVAFFSANEQVAGQILPNDSDFGNMTSLHNVGQFGARMARSPATDLPAKDFPLSTSA